MTAFASGGFGNGLRCKASGSKASLGELLADDGSHLIRAGLSTGDLAPTIQSIDNFSRHALSWTAHGAAWHSRSLVPNDGEDIRDQGGMLSASPVFFDASKRLRVRKPSAHKTSISSRTLLGVTKTADGNPEQQRDLLAPSLTPTRPQSPRSERSKTMPAFLPSRDFRANPLRTKAASDHAVTDHDKRGAELRGNSTTDLPSPYMQAERSITEPGFRPTSTVRGSTIRPAGALLDCSLELMAAESGQVGRDGHVIGQRKLAKASGNPVVAVTVFAGFDSYPRLHPAVQVHTRAGKTLTETVPKTSQAEAEPHQASPGFDLNGQSAFLRASRDTNPSRTVSAQGILGTSSAPIDRTTTAVDALTPARGSKAVMPTAGALPSAGRDVYPAAVKPSPDIGSTPRRGPKHSLGDSMVDDNHEQLQPNLISHPPSPPALEASSPVLSACTHPISEVMAGTRGLPSYRRNLSTVMSARGCMVRDMRSAAPLPTASPPDTNGRSMVTHSGNAGHALNNDTSSAEPAELQVQSDNDLLRRGSADEPPSRDWASAAPPQNVGSLSIGSSYTSALRRGAPSQSTAVPGPMPLDYNPWFSETFHSHLSEAQVLQPDGTLVSMPLSPTGAISPIRLWKTSPDFAHIRE